MARIKNVFLELVKSLLGQEEAGEEEGRSGWHSKKETEEEEKVTLFGS